jgi:hypothetical protein
MGKASRRNKERRLEGIPPSEKAAPQPRLFYLDSRIPSVLYRFFEEEKHANALVKGEVWISTLDVCRNYEQQGRGDSSEGELTYNSGYIRGDGDNPALRETARRSGIGLGEGVRNITISNNTHYQRLPDAWVLCATEDYQLEGIKGIGRHCVRINNPVEFFRRLTAALHIACGIREAVLGRIRYSVRAYRSLEPEPGPIGFVKPPDTYAHQKEVRMFWTPRNHQERLEPTLLKAQAIAKLCTRIA